MGVARVPVIMQLEALECGAASLAMVLAHYGKWIPLEQVRSDCGVSRDGSNAKNIYRAAENYGLKVRAMKMSPEKLREEGFCPCIIHWNMNHFVVLRGFRGDKVYINDPARSSTSRSRASCCSWCRRRTSSRRASPRACGNMRRRISPEQVRP